jgi:integrase
MLTNLGEGRGREEWLFTSPRGHRIDPDKWPRQAFAPAARAIGRDGMHQYELRHAAASLAIAAGADVKAVQKMLGHASAAMTTDRYVYRVHQVALEGLLGVNCVPGSPEFDPSRRLVRHQEALGHLVLPLAKHLVRPWS